MDDSVAAGRRAAVAAAGTAACVAVVGVVVAVFVAGAHAVAARAAEGRFGFAQAEQRRATEARGQESSSWQPMEASTGTRASKQAPASMTRPTTNTHRWNRGLALFEPDADGTVGLDELEDAGEGHGLVGVGEVVLGRLQRDLLGANPVNDVGQDQSRWPARRPRQQRDVHHRAVAAPNCHALLDGLGGARLRHARDVLQSGYGQRINPAVCPLPSAVASRRRVLAGRIEAVDDLRASGDAAARSHQGPPDDRATRAAACAFVTLGRRRGRDDWGVVSVDRAVAVAGGVLTDGAGGRPRLLR